MIEVIDADPEARQRTVKVKVAATVPAGAARRPGPGLAVRAIEFEGLQATPWVDACRCKAKETGKCGARMAYSLKATGVRAPSRLPARPMPEHKDAA